MDNREDREKYLDFNIKVTQQLLNVQFTGSTLEEKEAFYAQYSEQRRLATSQLLSEMYEVSKLADKALKTFPNSFINSSNELILEPKNNLYFNLEDVHSELDFKCHMLISLSRPIAKGLNKYWSPRVLTSLNTYLGTHFTKADMYKMYLKLDTHKNRHLTIHFIESNYDLTILD